MEKTTIPDNKEPRRKEFDYKDFLHYPEAIARELAVSNGLSVRIIKRDGIFLGEAPDYDRRRLNLTVTNGIVTGVRLG